MVKTLIENRVDGYKSGYTKRVDAISRELKLGKTFEDLSNFQQKKVEREYKKQYPNQLIQPENYNDDSKLQKLIKKIPRKKRKKNKQSLSKRGKKRTKADHDTMVKAGHDSRDTKEDTEGLGNPRGKKIYYDVMKKYSKRKKFSIPTCFCCKNTDWKFLAFDHIKERPESHKHLGGVSLAKRLIKEKYPGGIQILCHNCNTGKEIFGRVNCPHHLSKKGQAILKEVKLPYGKIFRK